MSCGGCGCEAPAGTGATASEAYLSGEPVREARELVAELCRHFYAQGWVTGTGGSITVFGVSPSSPAYHTTTCSMDCRCVNVRTGGRRCCQSPPENEHLLGSCHVSPCFAYKVSDQLLLLVHMSAMKWTSKEE